MRNDWSIREGGWLMQSDLVIMLLRTLFLYFVILMMFRIMGKREIGKLSIFDLVVSIMIAEIAVFSIEDPDMPLLKGLLPMFMLVLTQILISYISLKSRRMRELLDGRPSIIIEKGKLNQQEMKRQRYNFDDLLTQLREKDIHNLADVELAMLETTGKLSVQRKKSREALTAEDLGIQKLTLGTPLPVIIDGEVMDENLEKLGKTRLWLKQRLKHYGTTDFQQVFFASVDETDQLFVDLRQK